MIDKSLIKKRFSKSLKTYEDNAVIQKEMAEKLVKLLPDKFYGDVLEAGCATGVLTRKLTEQKIKYNNYYANDIVEKSKNYIEKLIPSSFFIHGDIENITLDKKFDLIISNACIQWCNSPSHVIESLYNALKDNGIFAFTTFANKNLYEISEIFQIKTQYTPLEQLKQCINKYNPIYFIEEEKRIYFNSATEILKHLKYTGVNSVTEYRLTKSKLQDIEQKFSVKFNKDGKVFITYNPVYVVIKKTIY